MASRRPRVQNGPLGKRPAPGMSGMKSQIASDASREARKSGLRYASTIEDERCAEVAYFASSQISQFGQRRASCDLGRNLGSPPRARRKQKRIESRIAGPQQGRRRRRTQTYCLLSRRVLARRNVERAGRQITPKYNSQISPTSTTPHDCEKGTPSCSGRRVEIRKFELQQNEQETRLRQFLLCS